MKIRKVCISCLVAFTLIPVLAQSVSSTSQLLRALQSVGNSMFTVDGGAPVPPVPHSQYVNTFTADGGAPVPPVPPKGGPHTYVMADGGAPVPLPIPHPILVADGGAPVPPVPPIKPLKFIAGGKLRL